LAGAAFHGHVTIAVTVVRPTDVIIFNSLELAIENAVVEDGWRTADGLYYRP
jgi:hypothetical protein